MGSLSVTMMLADPTLGGGRGAGGGGREGGGGGGGELTAIRPPVHTVEWNSQEGLCCIPLHQFSFSVSLAVFLFGSFFSFLFFFFSDVLRGLWFFFLLSGERSGSQAERKLEGREGREEVKERGREGKKMSVPKDYLKRGAAPCVCVCVCVPVCV